MGGHFSYIGPRYPYGAKVDTNTGIPDFSFPNPNGAVIASVSDGNGGWFIGGDFTMVGDSNRSRIAHINAAGQITAMFHDIGCNGVVNALCWNGTYLFAGGDFSKAGDSIRNRIAQFNNTGQVTAMFRSFGCNGVVRAFYWNGTHLFAGGDFSFVGDSIRVGIVQFNSSGQLTSMFNNGGFDGAIYALQSQGDTLYLGGLFRNYGQFKKKYGVQVNISDGKPDLNFDEPNGMVFTSIPDGSGGWFIGGDFTKVGDSLRNRIAQLDS